MFLLQCQEDNSFCVVHDENVIHNDNVVEGETVAFVYLRKLYDGVVIMKSDDEERIEEKFEILKKSHTSKKKTIEKKLLKKVHKGGSKSTAEVPIKKQRLSNEKEGNTQTRISEFRETPSPGLKEIEDSNVLEEIVPNKENPNKSVINNVESNDVTDGSNSTDLNLELENISSGDESQLFGKYCKEDKMIHIKSGVYCKERVLHSAVGTANRSSQLARRLLEGVFTTEALLNCTLSGQSPRAQGKERQQIQSRRLNNNAKDAIIDFSESVAKKKQWPQQTLREIKHSLAQKIGEIKRENKSNAGTN